MSRKGFTLVEILIVLVILGVVSIIFLLLVKPGDILARIRDTRRITTLRQIDDAVKVYQTIFGHYPRPDDPVTPCSFGGVTNYGDSSISDPNFMPMLERAGITRSDQYIDPLHGQSIRTKQPYNDSLPAGYIYIVSTDLSKYKLYTVLEKNDTIMADDGGICDTRYELGSDLTMPIRGCWHSGSRCGGANDYTSP